MLEKIINNHTLFDLFIAFLIYILAVFIGVFLKRNQPIVIPVIFVLMYSIYMYKVVQFRQSGI